MYRQTVLPQRHVIGIKIRTSNDTHQKDAFPLCEKFQQEKMKDSIPNKLNDDLLAIYTEYEKDYTKPYTYFLGCEVASIKEIPDGMSLLIIPKSSYAVFSNKGPFPHSLIKTWQDIWSSDVKRAYATDFEVYPSHFDRSQVSDIPIYISISG